jgi:hypothetical protein
MGGRGAQPPSPFGLIRTINVGRNRSPMATAKTGTSAIPAVVRPIRLYEMRPQMTAIYVVMLGPVFSWSKSRIHKTYTSEHERGL